MRIILLPLLLMLLSTMSGCLFSPLQNAASRGDTQKIAAVLDQGEPWPSDMNRALLMAADNGHSDALRLLLDRGKYSPSNLNRALNAAIERPMITQGHLDAARLLLDRGADVNFGGKRPVLFRAIYRGHYEIVRLLVQRGADIYSQGCLTNCQSLGNALDMAKWHGQTNILILLKQAETELLAKKTSTSPSDSAFWPKSDVDQPVETAKRKSNAYAVVVGIEQYQQALPRADFAAHDAEIMGRYLTKRLGYAEENVIVLLNERATKTGVEKYIEGWLLERVKPNDSVFIYFSGHGSPNPKTGKTFLVPYDGDPAFVAQTGYPLDRLYEGLAALPAKEIVVMLDSCFSGAGGRSVIAEGMRPMMLLVENPALTKGKIVVLAASSGGQISSTYKQKSHGLLTYFVFKGLQGDADQNHDGQIALRELYEYVKPQVELTARKEFHNEQTPQLLGNPDTLSNGIMLIGADNR